MQLYAPLIIHFPSYTYTSTIRWCTTCTPTLPSTNNNNNNNDIVNTEAGNLMNCHIGGV